MAEKKKKHWYDVDEASVVGGVKGFQMPIGGKGKKKKKNNPSKPYGEKEIYKEILKELDEEIEERVEKQGEKWVVIDPRTGATFDGGGSRDSAREVQRQKGITVQRKGGAAGAAAAGGDTLSTQKKKSSEPVKQRKPRSTRTIEGLKTFFKQALKDTGYQLVESSMLSYMFDEAITPDVNLWETAVKKLPRDVVMSDPSLREILEGIARVEARTLARSVVEIKKVLEGSGQFLVERDKADKDPDTGDVRMPFKVKIRTGEEEPEKDLLFGVRLEGCKPIILFPKESREMLNNMVTNESKLLRAELMHIQETVLDLFEDVIQEHSRRDMYLNEMHGRLHEAVGAFSMIEVVILKNLIRERLKGARKK